MAADAAVAPDPAPLAVVAAVDVTEPVAAPVLAALAEPPAALPAADATEWKPVSLSDIPDEAWGDTRPRRDSR